MQRIARIGVRGVEQKASIGPRRIEQPALIDATSVVGRKIVCRENRAARRASDLPWLSRKIDTVGKTAKAIDRSAALQAPRPRGSARAASERHVDATRQILARHQRPDFLVPQDTPRGRAGDGSVAEAGGPAVALDVTPDIVHACRIEVSAARALARRSHREKSGQTSHEQACPQYSPFHSTWIPFGYFSSTD
ncbi:MAG: hypothetical protein KF715_18985 [Candidatus Didemnitutus sp.]|nr:hypothetical protein [Candidatus Didemnitutus sp.]